MNLPKYLDYLQEVNYIVSGENKYYNIEKFKSDNNGKLFIVGLSGSGKTTLGQNIAKKYKAKYIKLDKIDPGFTKEFSKDKYGKVYIEDLGKLFGKLIALKGKYVIEGIDILYYDPNFFKDKPLIIMGTSILISSIRAYVRNFEKHHHRASRLQLIYDIYMNQKDFLRRLKEFEKVIEGR